MQEPSLYGFSTKSKLSDFITFDKLLEGLATFILGDSEHHTSSEKRRRLALLAGISLVGTLALIMLGILAYFQGNPLLGTLDITLSIVLIANLFDARYRGQYSFNISVGITFTSVFYIYLYTNGGLNQTAFVWYYTYPLIAMFLLGSKNGAIATGLMAIPVIFMMVFKPSFSFLAAYHFDFEIRFLAAYIVVGIFSFLIENAAEKNRRDIHRINKNLESLVEDRTTELREEVDQHKKAQELLHRSENRYRTMFEKSANAVFLVDKNTGYYLDANPAAELLTGRSKKELLALTTGEVTPDAAQDRLSEFTNADVSINMRLVKYIRPDGSTREALLTAVPIGDNLIMGLAQDITELKEVQNERSKLETKLNHAQKMEAIGTMAGGVAHDLNNILAGIVSYPEMIRAQLPQDSNLIGPLQTIEDAGKRAATVVNDLLTLSRNAVAAKQPTDLNKLIIDFINSPEWKNIKKSYPLVDLHVRLDAHSSVVDSSPVHIKKCIMNLLHNAYEATSPNGCVYISTENNDIATKSHSQESQPSMNDTAVLITLRDNGAGIPEEHLDHIFEPFYTTKRMGRSGTGLGLAIVWNTVTDHNGIIRVENKNPGAAFEISLPVMIGAEHSQPVEKASQIEKYKGSGTILIVDDEKQLREIACGMVEMLGYTAIAVANGSEAISHLTNNVVDLVFLDMILGEGMNGLETYTEMLKLNPSQKAVIVSGYSTSDDISKTLDLGASGIIKKPYSLEDIGKAIKKCLQQKASI